MRILSKAKVLSWRSITEAINSKPLVSSVVYVILLFLISFFFIGIQYGGNEDFYFSRIASGGNGSYDGVFCYVAPIYSAALAKLGLITHGMSVHSFFLVLFILISFCFISYVLVKRTQRLLSALILTPVILLTFALPDYTTIAYLCSIAGAVVAYYACDNFDMPKHSFYILFISGLFLVFIGVLLRAQSLYTSIPCILVLFLLFYKKQKKQTIKYFGLFILLAVLLTVFLPMIKWGAFNSQEYKDYIRYNNARTALLDSKELNYSKYRDVFEEIGWTENDHEQFYYWAFQDSEKYSVEKLERLVPLANRQRWNFNPKDFFSLAVTVSKKPQFIMTMGIFTFLCVAAFILQKKKRKLVILTFLMSNGIHAAFLLYNRSVYRVVAPHYWLGIIIILYFWNMSDMQGAIDKIKRKKLQQAVKVSKVAAPAALLVLSVLMACSIAQPLVSSYTKPSWAIAEFREFAAQNRDKVFLGDNPYVYYVPGIFMPIEFGESQNLLGGSVDINSLRELEIKRRFGIKNPVKEMIYRDDIYYMSVYRDDLIWECLKEYEPEVQRELVTQIGFIRVYNYYLPQ
ncbi:MAG: hypothetical protein LBS74_06005 [Oscillospiraceae bacterium]|jgi:hypothetical protein|nr:hypothetical protein [Oscillospiraceae bacterium]